MHGQGRRLARRFVLVPVVVTALLAAACSGGGDAGGERVDRAALPGCPLGALDAATGPVEVVVWHARVAEAQRTLEALVDRYHASQARVRVRLERQGGGHDELWDRFARAIPSRQLPAAVVVDGTATRALADSGVILPAQSCIDAEGGDLSAFRAAAVAHFSVGGDLYPASVHLDSALTYYNRDHFRRAGLDPDDPPETLDELRTAAEAIRAAGVASTPMVLSLTSRVVELWLTGAGTTLVDGENGRGADGASTATLAGNPAALEVLTWIEAMQADGLLDAIPSAEGQINQYLALASQSASFTVESSAAAPSVAAFVDGDLDLSDGGAGGGSPTGPSGLDIAAAPFAGLEEGGRGQVDGAGWYMASTTAPEVQAATWDFMRFLNSVDAQVDLTLGSATLPFVSAALDDPRLQAQWRTTRSGRWLALADEMLATGIDPAFPGPLIGPYADVRGAVRQGLEALTVGGRSPEEVLAQVQGDIDATLERYRGDGS